MGIGRSYSIASPSGAYATTAPDGRGEWSPPDQSEAIAIASVAASNVEACPCADPKNWWSTGKRFSAKRVVIVLLGTAGLALYVFFGYSPHAESFRALADNF